MSLNQQPALLPNAEKEALDRLSNSPLKKLRDANPQTRSIETPRSVES